uniref:Uncharacterized protein n=1 Tax=Arundo donax TaxID=35708 RepID=A0A0A9EE05_ARUDO
MRHLVSHFFKTELQQILLFYFVISLLISQTLDQASPRVLLTSGVKLFAAAYQLPIGQTCMLLYDIYI